MAFEWFQQRGIIHLASEQALDMFKTQAFEDLNNKEKAGALSIAKVTVTLHSVPHIFDRELQFDASLEDILVRVRSQAKSPNNVSNDIISCLQNSALLNEIVASLNKIVRSHVDELVVSRNSFYEQLFSDLVRPIYPDLAPVTDYFTDQYSP